ncbi:lysophospholipid acyltransferase family protein [uncultured Prevotella sp.]|uniref:lysophospholipid acyltransferase family protein n=1 Tax=uncultured Prevotella sp. TaxID=159272 RepID=UPI0027DD41B3|nr:lysophospholipid acyltransferase family protein [uncultured Prevotella sp.]
MAYKIVYSIFYVLSLLPFRVLYGISDFFYLIMYHIVGYRKKVVRKNLSSSFPEKTSQELKEIERGFYHWLCDYFVETLKLLTVSDETLLKHIEFRNAEQIEEYYDKGQTCAAILGHYCNWELLSATGLAFKRHKEAVCGLIYHPLRSKIFDMLFKDIRQSKGGVCIPKQEILRYLVRYKREKRMWIFGYISDQSPKYLNIHCWLPFLNHDTPVFTGGEKIMKKMNDAVFYVDMQRPERGKYICTFRLITDKPAEMQENEITKIFFEMLENTIKRDPKLYLWTHDRWKRNHEHFDKYYVMENGHVIKRKDVEL